MPLTAVNVSCFRGRLALISMYAVRSALHINLHVCLEKGFG